MHSLICACVYPCPLIVLSKRFLNQEILDALEAETWRHDFRIIRSPRDIRDIVAQSFLILTVWPGSVVPPSHCPTL